MPELKFEKSNTLTDTVTIRQATDADAKKIAAFNINMAMETENIKLLPEVILAGAEKLISNERLGFYLVAESGKNIVGSLLVTTEWSDWRNGQFWWLQSVYVAPKWRRKGLYRRLYETVKALAENNKDVCGYRLYVEKNNNAAQASYESLGMTQTRYKVYEELKSTVEFREPELIQKPAQEPVTQQTSPTKLHI